jgi:two-component system response regulator AlgR
MRVLIVDDEPAARLRLATLLGELDVEVAGEAEDAVTALELVRTMRPDVLLLDITMPEVDGFELVRHLPAPRPLVIFQTAHDEFALRAFEHEAVDYLLKPVTTARLASAIERARGRLSASGAPALPADLLSRLQAAMSPARRGPRRRVLVRHRSGHRLVPLRDVIRFVAAGGVVTAMMGGSEAIADYTLDELEERTAGTFVRASRAELVNVDRIQTIAGNGDGSATLTLTDGAIVRVSRRRAADVRRVLDAS